MNHHLGRSKFNSLIDSLSSDHTMREIIRLSVQRWGQDILKPAASMLLTEHPKLGYRGATLLELVGEDPQMLLSPEYLARPLSAAFMLPADVPSELSADAERYIKNYRAPGTLKNRASNFRKILLICSAYNKIPFPMTEGTAILIIVVLANEQKAYGTIAGMRNTIAMMHRLCGEADPTASVSFQRVWRGIERSIGRQNRNRKIALTRMELGDMIKIARQDGREDFATMMAVGYEGALRIEDLINLEIRNIHVSGQRWQILIPFSKTDQNGLGQVVELKAVPGASYDARRCLLNWLKRLARNDGYVFPAMEGGRIINEPQDSRAFSRALKGYAAAIGLDPSTVGTHSLRAGWATEAIDSGMSEGLVAAHLRHSSFDLLSVYYRPRHLPPNFAGGANPGWAV